MRGLALSDDGATLAIAHHDRARANAVADVVQALLPTR
jgi:hypothetical protein